MEALVRTFVASVERGEPSVPALEALGAPDPASAADAFARAARHPDLQPLEAWVPALATSARPGFGASALADLAERYRGTRRRALPVIRLPGAVRLLGSSDALTRVLLRHPHWVEELGGELPDAPDDAPVEPDWTPLRIAKYRGLLRIAARDLLGRPFRESLGELSALADRCLNAALERASLEHPTARPPSLLALGKLGGAELNFSSDVDLLFVWDPPSGPVDPGAHEALEDLIRYMKHHLEAPSEDGFGYRVDLELRPRGNQGPLVNTVDAALTYYETHGADWERQALIRARHVAGPTEPAWALLDELAPFVFRRSIDPQTIRAIHQMKLRIEGERRGAGREIERDVKEGPGGIRDVEFLTQALQLFHGGRHPDLRTGNVLDALDALEARHIAPAPVAEELRGAYLWLRRAEHALQMVEERQTQRLPTEPAGQLALARRMGYVEGEAARALTRWRADAERVREAVRQHFEALVLEPSFESRTRSNRSLEEHLAGELRGTPLFARLSTHAAPFLERRARDPLLDAIEGPALRGLARALTSSPELARYLSGRSALLERIAELGPHTLGEYAAQLESAPAPPADDLESFLDALRLSVRDARALAAITQLAGLADFDAVSRFLSISAETCVRHALEAAGPGRLAVVGMGKIAGREFTYHSDLDLIFLYPDDVPDPTGPSRSAQRLIHYLSTSTGAGTAFAVDSRLRPSGRQGLLVSTHEAFRRYQLERAATWEHVALMRARVIAGDRESAQALIDETRAGVSGRRENPWEEIGRMRGKVERERVDATQGVLELKTGAGGTMEVDFLAAGALLERGIGPAAGELPSVPAMLRAAAPAAGARGVLEAYAVLRRVEACARWTAGRAVESLRLASETAPLVAEIFEPGLDVDGLAATVRDARRRVRRAWERVQTAGSIAALDAD